MKVKGWNYGMTKDFLLEWNINHLWGKKMTMQPYWNIQSMWLWWVVMKAYKKKYLLHVPVVAKALRGKDLFPSNSPCNVISYCVEGDKPSISAFLTCPGSVVTWTCVAPDGALTSNKKLSNASSGADQARLTLVDETLTVRFPNTSFELSGSDPELITPASEVKGASVFRGRRRSGFWPASISRVDCGVAGASLMLSVSISGEVDFGATVNKSRLKNKFATGSADDWKRTCEEEEVKARTQKNLSQVIMHISVHY